MPVLRQSVGFIISWITVLGKTHTHTHTHLTHTHLTHTHTPSGTALPATALFVFTWFLYVRKKPAQPHCHCCRTTKTPTNTHTSLNTNTLDSSSKESDPLLGERRSEIDPAVVVEAPTLTWRDRAAQLLPFLWLFAPLVVFWAIFYQQSSTWVVQGRQMDCYIGRLHVPPGLSIV